MLEKVKQFFAGIASATIVLYAVGYISEYAHARMLGITMVDPPTEYYLISGGTFFLSTLFNLYSALVSHCYYLVLFLLVAAGLVYFDRYVQKSKRVSSQVLFIVLVLIIIVVYTTVVIPVFGTPLGFRDFLMRGYESIEGTGFLSTLKREMRREILSDNYSQPVMSHHVLYGLLWLFAALAGLVTFLMERWRRRCAPGIQPRKTDPTPPARKGVLQNMIRRLLPILTVILCIITAVLVIFIPIDHGILIKPNLYPEVHITMAQGVELMPDRNPDPNAEKYMWLLRENKDELLVHAIYPHKDTAKPVYKILVIRKSQVVTIEILKNSFILEIK